MIDGDYKRIFRLQAVVARVGEMDIARWWNTQGLLGPRGAVVLKRGLGVALFPYSKEEDIFLSRLD